MKLVIVSDTHGCDFSLLNLPEADMLIHAGDWTNRGTIEEVSKFNAICGKVLDKYRLGIYVTPGNHDWLAQTDYDLCERLLTNCNLMINEGIESEGIKFWFSPYTPFFCNWAFMEEAEELEQIWSKIPEDTNVLITHGGPHKVLDLTNEYMNVGCRELAKRVSHLEHLRLHAFGHIHSAAGITKKINNVLNTQEVTFANVAICDEDYRMSNKATIFEVT